MYADRLESPMILESPIWGDELIKSKIPKSERLTKRNYIREDKKAFQYIPEKINFKPGNKKVKTGSNYERDHSESVSSTTDQESRKSSSPSIYNYRKYKSRKTAKYSINKNSKTRKSARITKIRSRSSSQGYRESYLRSRSRERQRIHQQCLTIQKFGKINSDESQVFWDGFQWVKRSHNIGCEQFINATRRARRLQIGNLPSSENLSEEDFKVYLSTLMQKHGLCISQEVCPILYVWFSKDQGTNFGFVEFASIDEAMAALSLDGMIWHGSPISFNRPSDWKKTINDNILKLLTGKSKDHVSESLIAAAQNSVLTGSTSNLTAEFSQLQEIDQAAISELVKQQHLALIKSDSELNCILPVHILKAKIREEMLAGVQSRIIKIIKPFSYIEKTQELKSALETVVQECEKHGGVIAALIITKEVPKSENWQLGDVFLELASVNQADDCIFNLTGRLYGNEPARIIRFSEFSWKNKLKLFSEDIFKNRLARVIGC